jgi:sterol desaturase/sphingolipid hydroxylase (fatty acid hydroxylase superfamily)
MENVSLIRIYAVVALVAVGSAMLEGLVLTYLLRRNYDWKGAFNSLAIAVGRRLTDFLPIAFALPGAAWLYEHRFFDWKMNEPTAWVVLFFALEFAYYWFHRASHRVRWFWATHAVHHSPNQFNLSAAYRLGWTGKFTLTLIFFSPIALLGFPPQMILIAFALNLLYQFWIHAEWIPPLGFLEGIINTPSAHRVHHASNVEYLDANYGGVLLIFDRLFGTYIPEKRDVPIRYGWVQPITSNNPLRVAFQQWINVWADLRQAKNVREIAGYLFGPPGWQPDGNGQTTENLRAQASRATIT